MFGFISGPLRLTPRFQANQKSQRRHSDPRSQQSQSNELGRHAESIRLDLANLETDAYRAEQGVMGDISKRAKATSVRICQTRVNSQRKLKKADTSKLATEAQEGQRFFVTTNFWRVCGRFIKESRR